MGYPRPPARIAVWRSRPVKMRSRSRSTCPDLTRIDIKLFRQAAPEVAALFEFPEVPSRHRPARRGTGRRGAERIREAYATSGDPIDGRRFHRRIARRAGMQRRMIVCNGEQNIREGASLCDSRCAGAEDARPTCEELLASESRSHGTQCNHDETPHCRSSCGADWSALRRPRAAALTPQPSEASHDLLFSFTDRRI